MNNSVEQAVAVLRMGGVIAYPTEYCFGLGCDPRNESAVQRILTIKQRDVAQGLILVAADMNQVADYATLQGLDRLDQIKASWPGPNTWVLPTTTQTPTWISGQHCSVAMRVTAHPLVKSLCQRFEGAVVSTSANRHGEPSLMSASKLASNMGDEVDFILDGELSESPTERSASNLYHAITGEVLR